MTSRLITFWFTYQWLNEQPYNSIQPSNSIHSNCVSLWNESDWNHISVSVVCGRNLFLHCRESNTHLTPLILSNSCVSFCRLTECGTASRIIAIELFIIEHVVNMTIIENAKVHSGSAILAWGYWKDKQNKIQFKIGSHFDWSKSNCVDGYGVNLQNIW